MSTIALICGPRGAGKTSYCRRVSAECLDIMHMSLDDTMTKIFGLPWPDTDTGAWVVAYEVMTEEIEAAIIANPSAIILADIWNSSCIDREKLIREFLKIGADRVVVWYLVTPVDTARRWFLAREYSHFDREKYAREWEWKIRSYDLDHHRYHVMAHDLRANAITMRHPDWHVSWAPVIDVPVATIDPTQLLLRGMPLPTPFL